MREITAAQVKVNMVIVDQLGDKIVVDEVWDDQGPGLGIVVRGKRILDFMSSHNRYLDGQLPVKQIVAEPRAERNPDQGALFEES